MSWLSGLQKQKSKTQLYGKAWSTVFMNATKESLVVIGLAAFSFWFCVPRIIHEVPLSSVEVCGICQRLEFFFFFLVFRQIAVSYSYSKKHTRGSAFLSLQNTTQWTALIYTYVRHSQGAVRIHCTYTYWYTMFDPGMGSFWGKWPIIIIQRGTICYKV